MQLSAKEINSIHETFLLNKLVLDGSMKLLNKKGRACKVNNTVSKNSFMESGICYGNAADKMEEGYAYVEGYIIEKKDGHKTAHAWNMDKTGNHIDFTNPKADKYNYFGVVIPTKTVYKVGAKNGFIWYAVLPFVNNI